MTHPKFAMTIVIAGLPKNPNGAQGRHWMVGAGIRKKWRKLAYQASLPYAPAEPLHKCEIICTRYSAVPSDFDNLVASFKPIIDGIRDAQVIHDDDEKCIVKREYKNEKAKRGEGKVTVTVNEV